MASGLVVAAYKQMDIAITPHVCRVAICAIAIAALPAFAMRTRTLLKHHTWSLDGTLLNSPSLPEPIDLKTVQQVTVGAPRHQGIGWKVWRILPKSRAVAATLDNMADTALLMRLSDGRILPLQLAAGLIPVRNGAELMNGVAKSLAGKYISKSEFGLLRPIGAFNRVIPAPIGYTSDRA
jgi:hypothetical protein